MKIFTSLLIVFFSHVCWAKSFYDFGKKTIRFIDAQTGEIASVQEFVVYRNYDFPCILDGSRLSRCVDGPTEILPVTNGEVVIEPRRVKVNFFFAKNPRIGLQVSGSGLSWFSIDEFKNLPDPFYVKVAYHH